MNSGRDNFVRNDRRGYDTREPEKVQESRVDPLIVAYIEGTLTNKERTMNELFKHDGDLSAYANEIGLAQNQLRKFYESVVRLYDEGESIRGNGPEEKEWADKSKERLSVMIPLMIYSFGRASRDSGGRMLVITMEKIIQKIGEATTPDEVRVRIGRLKNVYQTIVAYSKGK